MNERIRELLEQAGYKPLPGFDFANSLDEVFMQKFAELIVQECVGVMDITDVTDFRGIELALKIKEHFGVE